MLQLYYFQILTCLGIEKQMIAVVVKIRLEWLERICLQFFHYSGPKDHVFVYFTDHGAPGLLAFPDDDVSILGDYFVIKNILVVTY